MKLCLVLFYLVLATSAFAYDVSFANPFTSVPYQYNARQTFAVNMKTASSIPYKYNPAQTYTVDMNNFSSKVQSSKIVALNAQFNKLKDKAEFSASAFILQMIVVGLLLTAIPLGVYNLQCQTT